MPVGFPALITTDIIRMRRDFRVKLDFSRIYKDARQQSWCFVDGSQIRRVRDLAEHIENLFLLEKPFHLLACHEETHCFLPFEEDVRVLENNDTVLIVPGTGIETDGSKEKVKFLNKIQYEKLVEADQSKIQKDVVCTTLEKSSCYSESFVTQNNVSNTSDLVSSANGTFYKTALIGVDADNTDSKISSNLTEDNGMDVTLDDSLVTNKRKRIRKRKTKKSTEILPESDTSLIETSGKKPKTADSVLISSGKHIRFQGIDNEESTSDNNSTTEQQTPNHKHSQNGAVNGKPKVKTVEKLDLSTLLNFRQSSTPLTFIRKKVTNNNKPETIDESDMIVEVSGTPNKSNLNLSTSKPISEGTPSSSKEKDNLSKEYSSSNNGDTIEENDNVIFKVFKIGADYTPQLSNMIVAKVLHINAQRYTFKLLHNKDELKEPEGKFSLPADDEHSKIDENDIITIEKSQIFELKKLKN